MHRLAIAGFLFVLGISGCTSMKASDAGAPAADHTDAAAGVPASPSPSPQSPLPAPQSPEPVNVPPAAPPSGAAQPKPAAAARPTRQSGAATPTRPPAAQAKTKSTSVPPAPAAASQPPPQALPTLNLTDLEQRLRETRAIGVFAKLSLKNQVDDLLSAFRELYRVPNTRPSAELRQRYDLLLLKVLSLLQDGDPPLASAIASSKEAIWSILADPDKFSKI